MVRDMTRGEYMNSPLVGTDWKLVSMGVLPTDTILHGCGVTLRDGSSMTPCCQLMGRRAVCAFTQKRKAPQIDLDFDSMCIVAGVLAFSRF